MSDETPEPNSPTGSATRILVVDDEPQLLRLMGRVLEREGHEVLDAPDGTAALAHAGATPPALSIIDLSIPPAGGAELMRELGAALPSMRIVLTSGADLGPELHAELAGLGGSFLRKPFAPRTLSEMVQRSLAGESHPNGLD